MIKWGLCLWNPGRKDGIHEDDVPIAEQLAKKTGLLTGLVFKCTGITNQFVTIYYQDYKLRVTPEYFKFIPSLKFDFGEKVEIKDTGKTGEISDIIWHFKLEKPIYFILFGLKKSSRRYFEEELEPLAK